VGHDAFSTQDIFITCDKGFEYQQNLSERRIAIILLSAQEWPIIKEHLHTIRAAVDTAVPGSYQRVECGRFRR